MQTDNNIDIKVSDGTDSSSKGKFKAAKKSKNLNVTKVQNISTAGYNFVTNSRYDTSRTSRLMTPLEARKKNAKLYGQTDNKSLRKKRRPSRHLSFKATPIVPTAPRDPVTIRKNWLAAQIRGHLEQLDIPLITVSLIMCVLGLVSVYSATLTFNSLRFVAVQGAACIMGIGIMGAFSLVDYRQLTKHYRTIIFLNVLMLVFTYIFGSSVTESTNSNWIDLGFIKIQPSEFSKLLFIYSFSVHISYVKEKLNKVSTFVTLFIHACLIFGLVLLQRDLGSLTIFLMIFIAMCFAAGLSIWYYILGGTLFVALSPFIWQRLNYYQQQRILMCFDSSIDPNGVGIRYQQMKSQIAIGSGGILGSGYTKGAITQGASGSLPAKHTDMIFTTICEEWGLIGALMVLGAACYLVYRVIKISLECQNPVGRLICVGSGAMLITQIIENVGMCLGVLPVIGITFPFLSYGGSSALSTFIAIGMVLSVSVHKEKTFFS